MKQNKLNPDEEKDLLLAILGDLHVNQLRFLAAIKKRFPFGDVTIKCRNGMPHYLIERQTFASFNSDSFTQSLIRETEDLSTLDS